MYPAHFVVKQEPAVSKEAEKECSIEEAELDTFYRSLRKKAERIPYGMVQDTLTSKVAFTFSYKDRFEDAWIDVAAQLGITDQQRINCCKSIFRATCDVQPFQTPLFYALKLFYGPQENGTLWGLIHALQNTPGSCHVLREVKPIIQKFVERYNPSEAISPKLASLPSNEQPDSGFASVSYSSYRSMSQNDSLTHTGISIASIENPGPLTNVKTFNVRTNANPLEPGCNPPMNMAPGRRFPRSNRENVDPQMPLSSVGGLSSAKIVPPDDDCDSDKKDDWDDPNYLKVFIPHTEKQEDIDAAREAKRFFTENFNIRAKILYDIISGFDIGCSLDANAPYAVEEVLRKADFSVPILSDQYMREIDPRGDPDIMPSSRLNLRYLHSGYQHQVLNAMSLNFVVRPLMLESVTFGQVRRIREFQTPLRFPNDLNRLGNILVDTKRSLATMRRR